MTKFILFIYLCCCCILAKGQTSGFTYQSAGGLLCAPATVNFTQTCTGTPLRFAWSFGNGQFSNAANPSVAFAAGTYTVKLLAIFQNQTAESSQTIVINPGITATINADRNYICTPGNINFSATTNGNIVSYLWDFGDGGTATTVAPTHAYTSFGNFVATVKATDVTGCSGTGAYNINVQKIPVSGTLSPVNGCVPALVTFTAAATLPAGASVVNYAWDFGDGTLASGASATTTNSYTTTAPVTPSVTLTTNEGCTNTFIYPQIAFGTPPTNPVAYPKKTVYCGSETTMLVGKAVNADSYAWDYGDGTTDLVTDTITQHKYRTLGTKTIKVKPLFHGCAGATTSFTIDIIGVIASYDYGNTCTDKKTFSFINTTQGNQSTTTWNFGDGSPVFSGINAVHTFPANGSFITGLSVTDNITGCSDLYSIPIYTATPTVTNADVSICRNSKTVFLVENNYTNPAETYTWHVVGLQAGPNAVNPFTIVATVFGDHTNNNVVLDNGPQYCKDTLYLNHTIRVRGPDLAFTAPASACANSIINITNNSAPFFASDAFTLTYWNYGQVAANDTIVQPAPFVYPAAGTYTIKLVAEDITGCRDSLVKPLRVDPLPFLHVIPRNDTLCAGQKDTLIAFHEGSLTWSPAAALSCTTCDTTIATPNANTIFYATALTTFGCITTDSTILKVFAPFTATPMVSPAYVCFKDSLRINVLPPGKRIEWSPGATLSDSLAYNPYAHTPVSTTYTAKLTDSAGCFSSSTDVAVIVKTLPVVDAGPDKIVPYNSSFTITPVYSSNVLDYKWAPAGTLTCVTCAAPDGIADKTRTYTITVKSDSGCVAKDTIAIFIECKYANLLLPTAFTPNGDNRNDVYIPYTRGIKTITKFLIYNRSGQVMYQAKDIDPASTSLGWDGRFKGEPQAAGAYVYFLEALCDLGQTITRQGSFVLLR